jgi:Predicted integral membrane protein
MRTAHPEASMDLTTMLFFGLILIFALMIPWYEGLFKNSKYLLIAVIVLGFAFALRASLLNYRSGDYNVFLSRWVEHFVTHGGFAGLSGNVGNYNVPYLYFLAMFSYLNVSSLYLIKLLSIFFDVVLAFGMMKLAGVFTSSVPKRLSAFLITLLLPTVILNGSLWGQCDSIYTAFAVLALWLVLSDRPKLSMVCMALSFGFKLQAVFIMPIFLVMLFAKRVKFWHFFIFPLTYVVEIIPAVICGKPFMQTLTLYLDQADSVGSKLNYNSPSLFALFKVKDDIAAFSAMGIALALLFVLAICVWAYIKRDKLGSDALLGIAVLFVVGIPFLLPHMHDRYFFMADVLTLLPAILYVSYIPVAVFSSFASLLCYYAYLKGQYLLPLSYGAFAIIAVLLVFFTFTADKLNTRRNKRYKI